MASAVRIFHGGAIACLTDHAATVAAATVVSAQAGVLTAEYKLNFLRPISEGRLLAEAVATKREESAPKRKKRQPFALFQRAPHLLTCWPLPTSGQHPGRKNPARPPFGGADGTVFRF